MVRSDKGTKRKTYDMSKRGWKKHLADIQRTLEDVEKFEKKVKRVGKRIVSESERRRKKRLAEIPESRRCPICFKIKLKRRQWVNDKDNGIVCCRSCWILFKNMQKGGYVQ